MVNPMRATNTHVPSRTHAEMPTLFCCLRGPTHGLEATVVPESWGSGTNERHSLEFVRMRPGPKGVPSSDRQSLTEWLRRSVRDR